MKRIYISDAVHEHLKREAKREGRTLKWLVENRLTNGTPIENTPSPKIASEQSLKEEYKGQPYVPKNSPSATPKVVVDNAKPGEVIMFNGSIDNPDFTANEQSCCQNTLKPCKHWVWDIATGEGYVNSLSGRKIEVE